MRPAIAVTTPLGRCHVFLGRGLLASLGALKPIAEASCLGALYDHHTKELFGRIVKRGLKRRSPIELEVRAGERSKTMATASRLLEVLAEGGADRRSLVVACGGGVVTDLGGFVASLYMRGVDWVAVPTTLLAAVDAAIGGKTGVDLPQGKNLAGTIHPPKAVVIDLDAFRSLSARQWRSGLAEVVKIALALDGDFFELLEREAERGALEPENPQIEAIVRRAIELKAHVVERDERDSGIRRVLNLGHTTGHALEAATGYRRFLHGEAVAIGLRVACELAVERTTLRRSDADRVVRLLSSCGLQTAWPFRLRVEQTLRRAALDKKAEGGRLRVILPTKIGSAAVTSAEWRDLARAASRCRTKITAEM
ncbi:MAG: 3-dehydroquinate synthase [Planctomycetes bacterium]|nr:3-dehydroquinate synthase [Planctomycetota bacterium]